MSGVGNGGEAGMFQRSAAGLSLTPGQRALLRLVEGLVVSAVIAGLQAVMPLLNAAQLDPSAVPWASVAHTFVATVMTALGLSVVKFFKAQGDGPMTTPPPPPAPPAPPAAPAVSAPPALAPTVPPIVGGIPAGAVVATGEGASQP